MYIFKIHPFGCDDPTEIASLHIHAQGSENELPLSLIDLMWLI